MQVQDYLSSWIGGQDVGREDVEALFGRLMDGDLTDVIKSALLVALAAKGESSSEIAGAASAMRRRLIPIPHQVEDVVDTCGTGGDGSGTFNLSTAAALVAAAAGVPIAKHGNRSVSSRSGSADVLAELGVSLDLTPEQAGQALREVGIAFLFAPKLHPAMREVMPVRRELGIRTLFNVLGPLTNPASAKRQLLGVYSLPLVDTVAEVLRELGCDHAMVVHGDGLDEITTTGITHVAEVKEGRVQSYEIVPEDLGLSRHPKESLAGGDPGENARTMRRVLGGDTSTKSDVALVDTVALNAGAAIYVGGRAPSLADGLELAHQTLGRGLGLQKLYELASFGGLARTGGEV